MTLGNHVRLIERETEKLYLYFKRIVKPPDLQHNDTFHVLRLRKLEVPFLNIIKDLNEDFYQPALMQPEDHMNFKSDCGKAVLVTVIF